jgi:hypothetical protein
MNEIALPAFLGGLFTGVGLMLAAALWSAPLRRWLRKKWID